MIGWVVGWETWVEWRIRASCMGAIGTVKECVSGGGRQRMNRCRKRGRNDERGIWEPWTLRGTDGTDEQTLYLQLANISV